MARRLAYTEKIVQRLTGKRELSLQTLRDMASQENDDDDGNASSDSSVEEDGGAGVDAETYDLQPLHANVARALIDGEDPAHILRG